MASAARQSADASSRRLPARPVGASVTPRPTATAASLPPRQSPGPIARVTDGIRSARPPGGRIRRTAADPAVITATRHGTYRPSAFYGYGALGLGYFYYDPFWGGYSGYGYYPYGGYSPYYGGGYYGGGYYGGGYYGGGYYGGGYGGGYGSGSASGYYGTGHLKLKVKPRDAEVYVDGYYAGLVDDFDGMFQKLELEAGPHRIEVRKAGFSTMTFEVRVLTDDSVTLRGELNELP